MNPHKECRLIKAMIVKSKYNGHAMVSGNELNFFLNCRGREALLNVTNGLSNKYRLNMIREVLNGAITFDYLQNYCQRLTRF